MCVWTTLVKTWNIIYEPASITCYQLPFSTPIIRPLLTLFFSSAHEEVVDEAFYRRFYIVSLWKCLDLILLSVWRKGKDMLPFLFGIVPGTTRCKVRRIGWRNDASRMGGILYFAAPAPTDTFLLYGSLSYSVSKWTLHAREANNCRSGGIARARFKVSCRNFIRFWFNGSMRRHYTGICLTGQSERFGHEISRFFTALQSSMIRAAPAADQEENYNPLFAALFIRHEIIPSCRAR